MGLIEIGSRFGASQLQPNEPISGYPLVKNVRLLSFLGLVAIQLSVAFVYRLSLKKGKFTYSPASAIATAEFIKLAFCAFGVSRESSNQQVQPFRGLDARTVCWILLLSMLYAVNNQFTFWLLRDGDVATFTLFKSSAPMMTALVRQQIFDVTMSKLQWFCIIVQCCGVILLEYNPCRSAAIFPLFVYLGNTLACMMTASSSVVNEYTLKFMKATLLEQNTLIYGFGVFFNLIIFFASPLSDSKGFFDGYDHLAVLIIFLNSLLGLAISFVYKYADAIVKTFAQPAVSSLAIVLSWMFLGMDVTFSMWVAAFLLIINVCVYMDHTVNPPAEVLPTSEPAAITSDADAVAPPRSPWAWMAVNRKVLLSLGIFVLGSTFFFTSSLSSKLFVTSSWTEGLSVALLPSESAAGTACHPARNVRSALLITDLDHIASNATAALVALDALGRNVGLALGAATTYAATAGEHCLVPAFMSLPWLPISQKNCQPFGVPIGSTPLHSTGAAVRVACCLPLSLLGEHLPGLMGFRPPWAAVPGNDSRLADSVLFHISRGLLRTDEGAGAAAGGAVAVAVARPGAVAAALDALCKFGKPWASAPYVPVIPWLQQSLLVAIVDGDGEGLFQHFGVLETPNSNCTSANLTSTGGDCGAAGWLMAMDTERSDAASPEEAIPSVGPAWEFSSRNEKHRRNLNELVREILAPGTKFGVRGPLSVVSSLARQADEQVTDGEKSFVQLLPVTEVPAKAPACGAGRVAIVVTGQLRTIMNCLPRYEEYLIEPNLADVFFFVTVSEGDGDKVEQLKAKKYVKVFVHAPNEDYDRLRLDHPDLPYDRRPAEAVPVNQLNMFRKLWQGNMLMKAYEMTHSCEYAWVVRLRSDMAMFKVLNISEYDPANLYIPTAMNHHGGINDIFAFGAPKLMDRYFDTYFAIPQLYAQGMHFHSESMLRGTLALHGLREARPDEPSTHLKRFGLLYDLVREDLLPFQPSYVPWEDHGPNDF